MKQEAVHEQKHIHIMKSRDKVIRPRHKRRYKRKKTARTHKCFCNVKQSVHHGKIYQGDITRFTPRIHAIPGEAPPVRMSLFDVIRGDFRIKCAQHVWTRAYQKIVKWQRNHQMNYRELCALRSMAQNGCLRYQEPANGYGNKSFASHYVNKNDNFDPYGDTDNENSDDSKEAGEGSSENGDQTITKQRQARQTMDSYKLDEEFLAFMEVSARHRFEHRRLKNESIDEDMN